MFFDIQTLERHKIPFDEAFPPGSIDFLDESIHQTGEICAEGVAELIDPFGVREIRVRGSVRGEVEVLCARCLESVRLSVSSPLDLFYHPVSEIAVNEEVAISRAETEIGFYEGGGVELADVIREQITMELPMRCLCREDCQGICPLCGTNRNRGVCSCREDISDPRWAALRNWKQ